MIKTKILQFFICYKTSVTKVPENLITAFCKDLYQLFIKLKFFVNIFIPQLLFSFHKIIDSVSSYHAGTLVRFAITRFEYSAKERITFHASLLKFVWVCLLFLTNIKLLNAYIYIYIYYIVTLAFLFISVVYILI